LIIFIYFFFFISPVQVDMAFEAVGAPTFMGSLRSLKPRGRLVLIGNVTTGTANLPVGLAIINGLEVIGSDRYTLFLGHTYAHAV